MPHRQSIERRIGKGKLMGDTMGFIADANDWFPSLIRNLPLQNKREAIAQQLFPYSSRTVVFTCWACSVFSQYLLKSVLGDERSMVCVLVPEQCYSEKITTVAVAAQDGANSEIQ